MAGKARWGALAFVVGAVLGSFGCDMQTMAYFLMPEAREQPKLKHLAAEPGSKKEPKVAILPYFSGLEVRAEFIQADRQIAEMLAGRLRTLAKDNDEKLTIVSQRKVEQYKNAHPAWQRLELSEIGKALGADYVIQLEINALSLYEPNSINQILRGRADIHITLCEVEKVDETPDPQPFSCVYPSEARGGVSVGFDSNPARFQREFLDHVAQELSRYFARYPKRDEQFMEGPSLR